MSFNNFNIARTINLHYRSDGDDFWAEWTSTAKRGPGLITYAMMTRITGRKPFDPSETQPRDFDKWIDHVKNAQPSDADRYEELRGAIHQELTQPAVFRMAGTSPFNLRVYVVGIDRQNNLVGIFANATET